MIKRIAILCLLLLLLQVGTSVCAHDTVRLYVSPYGSDYNDGSIKSPYATLVRANMAVQILRDNGAYPEGGIEIILRGGIYQMDSRLLINSKGSGEESAPVVYKNYDGESVVLRAAKSIPLSQTSPVSSEVAERLRSDAAEHVRSIDLRSIGIVDSKSVALLYAQNQMMTKARWPNKGFMRAVRVYDGGIQGQKGYVIGYDDPMISMWSNVQKIDIEGYGRYLWAYSNTPIAEIDTANKKIIAKDGVKYGVTSGARFYFSNVLEELDLPGEWYLDHDREKIYFYPLTQDEHDINIVFSKDNMLDIIDAKHIRVQGITFEGGGRNGAVVDVSTDVVFENCVFQFMAMKGLAVDRSNNSGILDSAIRYTGTGGVTIGGGDRYDLTPGNNFVQNCNIYRYSQIVPCYSAGVEIRGVGNFARYNNIHDSFHCAVKVEGNDNIIEKNEIYDVLQGTSDAGAIYSYNDAACRGNIISQNYIHHLGIGGETYSPSGIAAIYLDGFISGQIVEKNILYDLILGIHVNGGGFNKVNNNVFIDTKAPINIQKYAGQTNHFWQQYTNLQRDDSIWLAKYPEIAEVTDHTSPDATYKGNQIHRNIWVNSGNNYISASSSSQVNASNNSEVSPDIFSNYEGMDFSIRADSYVFDIIDGFETIDFSDIGIRH